MYVFPAFDSNYKTRKRTFKCCRVCRTKRLRCTISSSDYETVGCDNCQKSNIFCDLIVSKPSNSNQSQGTPINNPKGATSSLHTIPPPIQTHPRLSPPTQASSAPRPIEYSGSSSSSLPVAGAKVPIPTPLVNVDDYGGFPKYPSTTNLDPNIIPGVGSLPNTNIPNSNFNINAYPYNTRDRVPLNAGQSQQHHINPRDYPTNYDVSNQMIHNPYETAIAPKYIVPPDSIIPYTNVAEHSYPNPIPNPSLGIPSYDTSIPDTTSPRVIANNPPMLDTIKITPESLKREFGFNTSNKIQRPNLNEDQEKKEVIRSPSINIQSPNIPVQQPPSSTPSNYIRNIQMYRFLLSIDAFRLGLDDKTTKELAQLYFFKINSVFPIIYEDDFWKDFSKGLVPNIILYATIVVIARDKLAEQIFINNGVFQSSTFQVELETFYNNLILKIRQLLLVLPELGDDNKLARFICQLLLTLHFNFNKYGNEQSSHDLTDCINYAFSLGIHLKYGTINRPTQGNETIVSVDTPEKIKYLYNLWWIILIFDRMNAILNSKAIFIKNEDYNVDESKDETILRLIKISKSIENMLTELYSPSNVSTREKGTIPTEHVTFYENEFKIHDQDFDTKFNVFKSKTVIDHQESFLPKLSKSDYQDNIHYLLERLINNVIILARIKSHVEGKFKAKPNDIYPEAVTSAVNTLTYIQYFEDHEALINIPVIPTILSLTLSVFLKYKARGIATRANDSTCKTSARWNNKTINYFNFFVERSLRELAKFASKWWFVGQVIQESRALSEKLDAKLTFTPQGNSSKRRKYNTKQTRDKLKIQSLLSDEGVMATNPIQPTFITISSPTYYTKLQDTEENLDFIEGYEENEEDGKNDSVFATPEFVNDIRYTNLVAMSEIAPISLSGDDQRQKDDTESGQNVDVAWN
ncbi:hypothetical protein CAAN1_09S02388 [[Candida] anglica]|uniref:Zn(2)-C6 fungal-type domain-containing protein n=1 Tax=[Candida] anglica TaxID=148631 RepID=A0ABP0EEW4_9ASCO